MKVLRTVTVNVEAAHRDAGTGRLHGHSYLVECWTGHAVDLVSFEASVRAVVATVDHSDLDETIGDPSMEALAGWFLDRLPELTRVVVRRPTLGYAAEAIRD